MKEIDDEFKLDNYPVTFVQYLRPDGRKKEITIDRPKEIYDKAIALEDGHCALEAEVLTTGQVSFTVEREDQDGEIESLAHEICANGPGIEAVVDRLINKAHGRM